MEKRNVKVFVSYSSHNVELARKLTDELMRNGIDVWFDEWEILAGQSIVDTVYQGIRESDFLVLIMTKQSVESRWVRAELNQARKREIELGGTIVLPLMFEKCEVPECLRDKKYLEFLDFKQGFSLLLRDIKAHKGVQVTEGLEHYFEIAWRDFLSNHSNSLLQRIEQFNQMLDDSDKTDAWHEEVQQNQDALHEDVLELVSRALTLQEAELVSRAIPSLEFVVKAGWHFVDHLGAKVRDVRSTGGLEKVIIDSIAAGYKHGSIHFPQGTGSYLFRDIMLRANRSARRVMTIEERQACLHAPLRGFSIYRQALNEYCDKCGARRDYFLVRSAGYSSERCYEKACLNQFCPKFKLSIEPPVRGGGCARIRHTTSFLPSLSERLLKHFRRAANKANVSDGQ